MKIGGGGSVSISSDIARILGRVVIRDQTDDSVLSGVNTGGALHAKYPRWRDDYHLDFPIKHCYLRDGCDNVGTLWNSLIGTITQPATHGTAFGDYYHNLATNNVANARADIYRWLPTHAFGMVKFVAIWCYMAPTEPTPQSMTFQYIHHVGANARQFYIRHVNYLATVATRRWEYMSVAPAWTPIAGAADRAGGALNENAWQYMEATVDFSGANAVLVAFKTGRFDLGPLALAMQNVAIGVQITDRYGIEVATDLNAITNGRIGYVGIFEVE